MSIRASDQLPAHSLLQGSFQPLHYVDAFTADFHDPDHKIGPREAALAFFQSGPRWVGGLLRLRNALVGWLGLKTSVAHVDVAAALAAFRCVPGERIILFQVKAVGPNEVVLGDEDRHLDFRVSLWMEAAASGDPAMRSLTISTAVRFHNRWGRLYFFPVKPFHRLIVRVMLRRTVQGLGTK